MMIAFLYLTSVADIIKEPTGVPSVYAVNILFILWHYRPETASRQCYAKLHLQT